MEAAAGEDDSALERLYRSDDWQRLDYGDAMLGYWIGWAQLSRGQALPAGTDRRAAMQAAETAFARSALELRLPKIATASLLGLGAARHDLGDLDGARSALERLERQLEGDSDAELRSPALYELAAIAFEQGEIERGRELAARLPAEQLERPQRLDLMLREAEGWLRRADAEQGGAEAAASLLRQLIAAGGDSSQRAAALVERHWSVLAGRDVGPLGDLLTAESAFEARHFAEAADAYARALAAPDAVPGLEPATARYKYARSLAESERSAAAIHELEELLADGGGGPVRKPAATLLYGLAEAAAAAEPGPSSDARALRAAEILVAVAPDSPGAGNALLRVARSRETQGAAAASIAELAKIPAASPAYARARLDMARLRAARLQQLDAAGRLASAEGRSTARALLADLDTLQQLIAAGRLDPEAARDATFAVFRAKAAAATGAAPSEVFALLAAAEALPDQDAAGMRAIARLRLHTLVRAQRFAELATALGARSDAEIRSDWPLWLETLTQLEAQPAPPQTLLAWYERLAPLAPDASRDDLALGRGRALLAAGRAEDAVAAAQALTGANPSWGDAWLLQARALDATAADAEAYRTWSKVAAGVEVGSARWVDANLGAAEAARRLGDHERACLTVAVLADGTQPLGERQTARLARIRAECLAANAPGDTRLVPARSDSTSRLKDRR
jgi:hypothetical protein